MKCRGIVVIDYDLDGGFAQWEYSGLEVEN